jgi:predicted ribosome quality control (RQC) complex YloA/Tae2 family protein
LAPEWKDKPHRLIYDLCNEIERLQKLLKMAEDELIESDNHGRAQEKRADALEAELENVRDASKNIAELQREACAWHCDDILHKKPACTPNDIRATSLVMTESK